MEDNMDKEVDKLIDDIQPDIDATMKEIGEWLGYDGLAFFAMVFEEFGDVSKGNWDEGGIPHIVHFREGMQVRNKMRNMAEYKDWDAHTLDNNWASLIHFFLGWCHGLDWIAENVYKRNR